MYLRTRLPDNKRVYLLAKGVAASLYAPAKLLCPPASGGGSDSHLCKETMVPFSKNAS